MFLSNSMDSVISVLVSNFNSPLAAVCADAGEAWPRRANSTTTVGCIATIAVEDL